MLSPSRQGKGFSGRCTQWIGEFPIQRLSAKSLLTTFSFSAATIGLPSMLKEEDIQCEYPANIDDEYITEKGYLPTLPTEPTKVSSALALFRVARILSKVLERNYPAATSYDLSLLSLSALDTELSEWCSSLPSHLRLTFAQDKPSADITGNRSALLVRGPSAFLSQTTADLVIVPCVLLYSHPHPPSSHWLDLG